MPKKQKLCTTRKRLKKHGNGITRCESLSMRPIKQRVYKWGNELVPHTLQILKCTPVSFLQIVHIKHNGTKFLIREECFPNPLHHPNKMSTTLSGKTRDKKISKQNSTIGTQPCSEPTSDPLPLHNTDTHNTTPL